MIREIKTFELICDRCQRKTTVSGAHLVLPKGWDYEYETYGTGYYDHSTFLKCSECRKT